MSNLYISESQGSARTLSGNVFDARNITNQTVVFTTNPAVQSSVFQSTTNVVRIQPDANCFVVFGANPTATTSGMPLVAGRDYDFLVTPGSRLSVIGA